MGGPRGVGLVEGSELPVCGRLRQVQRRLEALQEGGEIAERVGAGGGGGDGDVEPQVVLCIRIQYACVRVYLCT